VSWPAQRSIKMRLYTSIFLWLLASAFITGTDELIPWKSDRKLTWADFKSKKQEFGTGMDAYTAYMLTLTPENNGKTDSITVHVECSFDKNKSAVRKGKLSDELLKHEQGHFDLAEVYARLLRKKLSATKTSLQNAQSTLNDLYKSAFSELEAEQAKYDRETDHSRVADKQELWNKKIEDRLTELEKFSGTVVKVKITK
jgi:hypothetical protein